MADYQVLRNPNAEQLWANAWILVTSLIKPLLEKQFPGSVKKLGSKAHTCMSTG